jgi:hypothetical protein
MKTRVRIALGLVPAALVVLLLYALFAPPAPLAHIRVLDEGGRPVAGATITPDGLRPKKNGGHYMWNSDLDRSGVRAVTVRTDADGYARVRYPFYVIERLETAELSFVVDHPHYCADRPFRVVGASPPANAPIRERLQYWLMRITRRINVRPQPVVLRSGALVKLTGYIGSRENVVPVLHADVSDLWPAGPDAWQRTGKVLSSAKIVPGEAHLRAMHLPTNGPARFSELVTFQAKAGETNEFVLELKPGARVAGRFDETAPRPVKNGRVCTRVFADGHDGNSRAPVWVAWQPVGEDGTFLFESLPPGRMELIGICEGFVSQSGSQGRSSSQRVPQLFNLQEGQQAITLVMERAGSCEITVLDDLGRPLPGASVGFWPNVLWGHNGSTIFAADLYNSEDTFRGGEKPDWSALRKKVGDDYQAVSDQNGVALIRTLPASHLGFSVTHTNYEMPIVRGNGAAHRNESIQLTPGETGRAVIKMQKRGTEALTH